MAPRRAGRSHIEHLTEKVSQMEQWMLMVMSWSYYPCDVKSNDLAEEESRIGNNRNYTADIIDQLVKENGELRSQLGAARAASSGHRHFDADVMCMTMKKAHSMESEVQPANAEQWNEMAAKLRQFELEVKDLQMRLHASEEELKEARRKEDEMIQEMLMLQESLGKDEKVYTEDEMVAMAAATAEKVQKDADRQLDRRMLEVAKATREIMTAEFENSHAGMKNELRSLKQALGMKCDKGGGQGT